MTTDPLPTTKHRTSIESDFVGVGYLAVCSCGWTGERDWRDTVDAAAECAEHVRLEEEIVKADAAVDAVMSDWEEI